MILSGISLGLESAVYTAVLIALAVFGTFLLGSGSIAVSLFAVALAGCGLLTTAGVIVAMDTFGPVSDNAQGVAEMSGDIDEAGARVLTDLDAVGNTTKAITKGIAIATAVLAATALFGSFTDAAFTAAGKHHGSLDFSSFSIVQPNILVGAIIGAAAVFLFSGLAISAVGRAAGRVVFEVRQQFREHPGIMDFTEKPDYARVVDICTKDSLRELATPGLLAIFAPICVGFAFGAGPLAGYLAGAIAAGVLMAVFLANSGGAWDNAKKMVEDGLHGGKGSDAHSATVIGDTVGDPFKDTAGPSINPLIKVMNLVAVLIAPAVVQFSTGDDKNNAVRAVIAILAFAIIATAVIVSKRRVVSMGAEPGGPAAAAPAAGAPVPAGVGAQPQGAYQPQPGLAPGQPVQGYPQPGQPVQGYPQPGQPAQPAPEAPAPQYGPADDATTVRPPVQPPAQPYQPPAQPYQPPAQPYQPPAQPYQPPVAAVSAAGAAVPASGPGTRSGAVAASAAVGGRTPG